MSRAFQTLLERAPKHAGAWMAAIQALREASALDKKTSALEQYADSIGLRDRSSVASRKHRSQVLPWCRASSAHCCSRSLG